MKLNAYGRLIEVIRENEEWFIYDLGEGKKRRAHGIYIPSELTAADVVVYLEDLLHEQATPERPKITLV